MKVLVFNDGRQIQIQKASAAAGALHVRMILADSEQLKALFMDEFATSRMTEMENGVETASYEGYTTLSYIKEEAGGIWEVEMLQPEADLYTRMADVEKQARSNTKVLEQAIMELTMMVGALMPAVAAGPEESVQEGGGADV